MKQAVYKYIIPFSEGIERISMPREAQILHCELQNDKLCLWALVRVGFFEEERAFVILGTGWKVPNEYCLRHITTYQIEDMGLVWHVFEVMNPDHEPQPPNPKWEAS